MSSLAIIGTGIAGLGCAHFLHRRFEVTLFEQNAHTGGHANTATVTEPVTGRKLPVDTGFMVFNHVTYPLLTRLFRELGVPTKPTTMSFSVRHEASGLEFAGSSLNHLFAQRRNLFRPRFIRMLLSIDRFNREAGAALDQPEWSDVRLDDYVRRRGYGDDFLHLYLIPMSSAVWSTPPERMLEFPATTLLRFFHNHGFLGLHTQHPWWTVEGGSQAYVRRMTAPFRDRILHQTRVVRVRRETGGVLVTTSDGMVRRFDRAILAGHADQSLALLADPTLDEGRLLGPFHYQPNIATLHTDASVMPRTRLAWSAWNYSIALDSAGAVDPATHYWMNALQGVSERENYFVTINRPHSINPAKVLQTISYEHPLFSLEAVRAQVEIPNLNEAAAGRTETYYAGAWQRYGFHEDGLWSAYHLCRQLLGTDPWPTEAASLRSAG